MSGGVPDGGAAHPDYRYGGLWKNHHANAAAAGDAKKKSKSKSKKSGPSELPETQEGDNDDDNDDGDLSRLLSMAELSSSY